MDTATLARAMGDALTLSRYAELTPAFNDAMRAADINTVRRAAAWCSQLGHESAGLRFMAEIQTSGPDWSFDRTRYRGRGPIQVTWRSNYAKFGAWCKGRGYVTDANVFVNQPELVERPRWGFLAASWYWLNGGPRPGEINAFADQGNILNVSRCVNGWVDTPNGMPDRTRRWHRCLELGAALLPGEGMSPADIELTKRFPSRSKYRANDLPVDTLAGFILNIDARVHENYVESRKSTQ